MKIITVVGARPQFIKAAAVSREINLWNQNVSEDKIIAEDIIHTGQHYDAGMSEVFFQEMCIPHPSINLQVGSGKHGAQTGEMLSKLEDIFEESKPDVVLVYGDTNSTLAGALAASKLHIPIAHVEAGLRSYNKKMPEEQNRVLTDHLSSVFFCPTQVSIDNLKKEGFVPNTTKTAPTNDSPAMIQSGDVMYDCVLYYAPLSDSKRNLLARLNLSGTGDEVLPFILATIHRAENTDDIERFQSILSALSELTKDFPVVLPLHPRSKKIIKKHQVLNSYAQSLIICEPVSYLEMILLEKQCRLICTDSGGVQKEAYFFQKPCVTFRDQTEWVETVEAGWNIVVSSDYEKIIQNGRIGLNRNSPHIAPFKNILREESALYGDGKAAQMIVENLFQLFG
ncbi:UDP-N-acetylglucosamine 2-epimerase (non-hydrolyzing) [Deltaproteobacteria bacterium TL4]